MGSRSKCAIRIRNRLRTPKSKPPMPDATRVSEFSSPAVRVSIANSRMRNAITREYNITSMASSIQPRPPATSVRRSAAVVSCGQLNSREETDGFAEETLAEVSASATGLNSCQKDLTTLALLLIAQHRNALCRYDKSLHKKSRFVTLRRIISFPEV